MKNILTFIICFISQILFCQQSNVVLISNALDSLYQDNLITTTKEEVELSSLDTFLISIFHLKDSLLEFRLKSFINFRESIRNINDTLALNPLTSSEIKFLKDSKAFEHFQTYLSIPYSQIPDSIIYDDKCWLLNYHQVGQDTNFLCNLFRNGTKFTQIIYAYNRLFSLLDSVKFTQFYYDNLNIIANDSILFLKVLDDSKEYFKPFPLDSNSKLNFIQHYDTNVYENLVLFNYYFENGPSILEVFDTTLNEIIAFGEKNQRESEYNLKIELENHQREIDSMSIIDFRNSDPQFFSAVNDSTIYGNDYEFYPPIPIGDDGMRFDTLTNDSLFYRLEHINITAVYDTISTEEDLNSNSTVIHLRKILQIIGDRFLNNTLDPNTSQTALIDQVIDQYTEYIVQDSVNVRDRTYEALMQICRLWRLAEHKYINWPLTNSTELHNTLFFLVKFQANEAMIINFIQRADSLSAIGNLEKATIYIAPLSAIYDVKNIQEHSKEIPPRRPLRSLEDSNRWCKDYIIPALRRYNFID